MFLVDFPEFRPHVEAIQAGLIPFPAFSGDIPSKLIVKASKETILTAVSHGEFFIYRVPFRVNGELSFSLISAFRDDAENPLTIFTPIMGETDFIKNLRAVLLSDCMELHFFDEHTRERVAYVIDDIDKNHAEQILRPAAVYPGAEDMRSAHAAVVEWFGRRSKEDDTNALRIPLNKKLYRDNFVIVDVGDAYTNRFYKPVASGLVRAEAGPTSEEDIAHCFSRTFKNGRVFVGPTRLDNGRELADIVVVDDDNIIIIQAKDSPNTEAMLARTIERKAKAARNLAESGFSQLRGAIRHVQEVGLSVKTAFCTESLPPNARTIYGIVVIKEKFPQDYKWYVEKSYEITKEKGVMTVLLSYRQLHEITHHVEKGDDFIRVITQMYFQARYYDQFPEINFINRPMIAHYTLRGEDE